MDTATAIREGRVHHVDLAAVAEEIENLGKSERRALSRAVSQLYVPLLKQRYQPELAGSSWEISVKKQGRQITKLIEENPSFKPMLTDQGFIQDAYEDGSSKLRSRLACRKKRSPLSARSRTSTSASR